MIRNLACQRLLVEGEILLLLRNLLTLGARHGSFLNRRALRMFRLTSTYH